jgi:hypothetical protein
VKSKKTRSPVGYSKKPPKHIQTLNEFSTNSYRIVQNVWQNVWQNAWQNVWQNAWQNGMPQVFCHDGHNPILVYTGPIANHVERH